MKVMCLGGAFCTVPGNNGNSNTRCLAQLCRCVCTHRCEREGEQAGKDVGVKESFPPMLFAVAKVKTDRSKKGPSQEAATLANQAGTEIRKSQ